MGEPWLRHKEETWVPSPQVQGVYNITVNELMHPNEKLWDKNKIDSLFDPHVAKRILDIPLFSMIDEDKLVWVDSMYEQYSVKSGYNLCMTISGKFPLSAHDEDWDIAFGKFMHHQRQNIFFGVYAKGAYQLAPVSKKGVSLALCLALFVIMIERMIGMCCLIVNLVSKVD
jgi:hypothetical protein